MTTFQELTLHPFLLSALEKLEFNEATEVQEKTIPTALEGKDIIVSAKTGSGKTLAFLLPLLHRLLTDDEAKPGTRGLILLPTRELALQTYKILKKLVAKTDIKATLVMGGEPFKQQRAVLRKNPEIIIATPGRLVEHIEHENLDLHYLDVLILDEADRMLDMGFAEDMNTIVKLCNRSRQSLLFSATLKHKGFRRLYTKLNDPVRFHVGSSRQAHEQITQQMILADNDHHKENLVAALIEEEQAERVFVFCNTRLQAQKVSNILTAKKLRSNYIHGEVSHNGRKQVMGRLRDGVLQVLVATDLAARGLDIKDLDLVINFNVARSGDDHVHRVGRTGRADKKGLAVTLVNSQEWNKISSIARYLKISIESRQIKGLEADYKGPKKIKKSGKAAGTKKKKLARKLKAKKK